MSGTKKKKGRIALAIVGAFVLALGIFLIVWYCGASYPQFDSLARQEFAIPGLSEGVCPQGLTDLPKNEQGYDFAMSGYLSSGASRVYFIDEENEEGGKYITVAENGKADESHFGGVACSEDYLYVASGNRIARVPLSEALAAENGGAVEADYFDAGLNAAFCQCTGNMLYVGEFYRPGNYETPESHHLQTADGSMNYAVVYAYEVDDAGAPAGVPSFALSVREQVQGIAVFEGGIALSCSYGLPDSSIWVYENPIDGETDKSIATDTGANVPLYMLDSSNWIKTIVAPCMSEELAIEGGRLYILFESLSNKYKLFTRTRMSHVHSIALSDLAAAE